MGAIPEKRLGKLQIAVAIHIAFATAILQSRFRNSCDRVTQVRQELKTPISSLPSQVHIAKIKFKNFQCFNFID
jgi:hypothetical protein